MGIQCKWGADYVAELHRKKKKTQSAGTANNIF